MAIAINGFIATQAQVAGSMSVYSHCVDTCSHKSTCKQLTAGEALHNCGYPFLEAGRLHLLRTRSSAVPSTPHKVLIHPLSINTSSH